MGSSRKFVGATYFTGILYCIMRAGVYKSADHEFARAIATRSKQMWRAYRDTNEPAHSAMLTDDYVLIHPDGTMHGRVTAQSIAAAAIAGFKFSDRKSWRLGSNAALSTYYADVDLPEGTQPSQIRLAASEVCVQRSGE